MENYSNTSLKMTKTDSMPVLYTLSLKMLDNLFICIYENDRNSQHNVKKKGQQRKEKSRNGVLLMIIVHKKNMQCIVSIYIIRPNGRNKIEKNNNRDEKKRMGNTHDNRNFSNFFVRIFDVLGHF